MRAAAVFFLHAFFFFTPPPLANLQEYSASFAAAGIKVSFARGSKSERMGWERRIRQRRCGKRPKTGL